MLDNNSLVLLAKYPKELNVEAELMHTFIFKTRFSRDYIDFGSWLAIAVLFSPQSKQRRK